jgi:hypothetical protein
MVSLASFSVRFTWVHLWHWLPFFVETWVDSKKYVAYCRRPVPKSTDDIGTWYTILDIMSQIAVITNLLIVFFVLPGGVEVFPDTATRITAFVTAEHLVFVLKFGFGYLIPDEAPEMEVLRRRSKYIEAILVLGQEEENEDEFKILAAQTPVVHETYAAIVGPNQDDVHNESPPLYTRHHGQGKWFKDVLQTHQEQMADDTDYKKERGVFSKVAEFGQI